MSDDFIPLNQSTPRGKSQQSTYHNNSGFMNNSGFQNNSSFQNNRYNGNTRRGGYNNRRGNNSRNSSFGSDSNTSFSQSQDRNSIDAYLHPSMLEDPWARLRLQQNS